MSKTLTLRLDEETYSTFARAAKLELPREAPRVSKEAGGGRSPRLHRTGQLFGALQNGVGTIVRRHGAPQELCLEDSPFI